MAKDSKKNRFPRLLQGSENGNEKGSMAYKERACIIYQRCHTDMRSVRSWVLAHRYRRFSRS